MRTKYGLVFTNPNDAAGLAEGQFDETADYDRHLLHRLGEDLLPPASPDFYVQVQCSPAHVYMLTSTSGLRLSKA